MSVTHITCYFLMANAEELYCARGLNSLNDIIEMYLELHIHQPKLNK